MISCSLTSEQYRERALTVPQRNLPVWIKLRRIRRWYEFAGAWLYLLHNSADRSMPGPYIFHLLSPKIRLPASGKYSVTKSTPATRKVFPFKLSREPASVVKVKLSL